MGTILQFRRSRAEESAWLLLRMYDEVLDAIDGAGSCIYAHDYPGKASHISKAISIFHELTCSLDDRQDNLARNLDSLYLTCTAKLVRASAYMNTEPLESARIIIVRLRSAVADAIPSMPKNGKKARILPFSPMARHV